MVNDIVSAAEGLWFDFLNCRVESARYCYGIFSVSPRRKAAETCPANSLQASAYFRKYTEDLIFKPFLGMAENIQKLFHEEKCVICLKDFDVNSPAIQSGKKELKTLLEFSKKRKCENLLDYLTVRFF